MRAAESRGVPQECTHGSCRNLLVELMLWRGSVDASPEPAWRGRNTSTAVVSCRSGREQQYLREGEMLGMSNGQEGRLRADGHETGVRPAVKPQLRRPAVADDFHARQRTFCVCPVPSAFIAASFAAKRAAKWMAGVRRRLQYAISPSVKIRRTNRSP